MLEPKVEVENCYIAMPDAEYLVWLRIMNNADREYTGVGIQSPPHRRPREAASPFLPCSQAI